MAKRKTDKTTKPEKEYTFDEYLSTFLPKSPPKKTPSDELEEVGKKMAERALRRIREALQQT